MVMDSELALAFDLTGRVCVVTGAASGIGREIALVLSRAGAKLFLADLDDAGLASVCSLITERGADAAALSVDMSILDQVNGLADAALAHFGCIDVWVNAAGILISREIADVTQADLDRVLSVNLEGVFWGCAAAIRAMKPRGSGVIINISSGGGEAAVPGLSLYSMSKAGVNMLTRTVAKECGPHGIRANCIAPGWVETEMVTYRFRNAAGEIDPAKRAEVIRQRAQASPISLTGTPRDIALAALYLASDASRFVTGQILRPNGGVAMP